ncbi:sulfatase-like hydrolase/transferase [candidate division KSB1 bacterium]|nr:sulfatase-like hydrolase/transferase [candidate division KSB1 bacterium]
MNRRIFLQQSLAVANAISAKGVFPMPVYKRKTSTRNKRPNILFFMTDQLRYDCLGANGNQIIRTPHLDRLAKQSANFSHAFVQAPVCTPSRACFFTGRYAHAHKNRVNYTELDERETLLPKYLQNVGYETILVGKTHLYYQYPPTPEAAKHTGYNIVDLHDGVNNTDAYSSYAKWRAENDPQKDIYYRQLAQDVPELKRELTERDNPFRSAIDKEFTDTAWIGLRTRDYIRQYAKADKPFFLFSSFWKPHSPFEVPAPYDSMYNEVEFELPQRETRETILKLPPHVSRLILRNEYRGRKAPYDMDEKQLQWIYRSYYGTISHIDHEVGQILKTLEETGQADNTIIIFTSDHGDQLLEHGLMGKNVLFDASVRVPFMIKYPNHIRPGQYDDLVMSIDLLPTLFEMLGLAHPYNCHGQSLLPLIGNSDRAYESRNCVFCENVIPEVFANVFNFEKGQGVMGIRHPDGKMVRTKRWKYNYYPKGFEELYDLKEDAGECKNLANDPQYRKVCDEMKSHLLDWLITATETEQIAPKWLI